MVSFAEFSDGVLTLFQGATAERSDESWSGYLPVSLRRKLARGGSVMLPDGALVSFGRSRRRAGRWVVMCSGGVDEPTVFLSAEDAAVFRKMLAR